MFIFRRPLIAPLLGLLTAGMLVAIDARCDLSALVLSLCVFSGEPSP